MQVRRNDLEQIGAVERSQSIHLAVDLAIDIGSPGHEIAVNWAPALGATKAEVTQASATISPFSVVETEADVPATAKGNGWVIDIPNGKRLSSLSLHGFKESGEEEDEIVSAVPDGRRITLGFPSQQGGGYDPPRFAVPALSAGDNVRRILSGASFSNRVLRVDPAVSAPNVLLSLVDGDNPSEFTTHATELSSVDLTTETPPNNAKLTGPGGNTVWQSPSFDPAGPDATVDLRAALETALNQQLAKKQAPQAVFTLSADAPAQVYLNVAGPSGALLRSEKGVITTSVEGGPIPLPLSGPLPDEIPSSATADVTVKYEGIRILENVSDDLPSAAAVITGIIVGLDGAVRALPPLALDGQKPAKVGLYGRAPEDCELSIEFVRMVGTDAAESLAPPAVLQLKRSESVAGCWARVPKGTQISGPAAVRVRANKGRFFWVDHTTGQGVMRIAIFDPDPGGRPLLLNGLHLLDISTNSVSQKAFSFPPSCFHGSAPVFTSNLFLAVQCADLTLRYAR
jgi:hypothetical protein